MKRTILITIIILLIIAGIIWFFIPGSDDDPGKSVENQVEEPIKIDSVFKSVEIYKDTVHKNIFDLEVYFFDVSSLKNISPAYKGDPIYTGYVYVVDYKNKTIKGPYSTSSTFPDSKPNNPVETYFNTVMDGPHIFNNRTGHSSGTRRGLNLVLETGLGKGKGRYNLGFDKNGDTILMSVVNVHSGAYSSRGSRGCLTILPTDANQFFKQFGMEHKTTGDLEGGLYIFRNDDENVMKQILNQIKSEL